MVLLKGGVPRTLEQKLDSVLQALEQQNDDNAALKLQLQVLEEKFDNNNSRNNSSGSANKKARIPSSLSVSALCFLFKFLFIYYLYRKKLVKYIASQGISLMVHNCEKITILLSLRVYMYIPQLQCCSEPRNEE